VISLSSSELGSNTAIPYATAFSLMGLCILISLGAALLSVWGASGEKPLNVLRYE
jgi:ABC-type lipoprotein release transport system permease subunit